MNWLLVVFAIVAGTLLPIQAGINTQLARNLGHPLLAASISFVVGSLVLLLYTNVFHISSVISTDESNPDLNGICGLEGCSAQYI